MQILTLPFLTIVKQQMAALVMIPDFHFKNRLVIAFSKQYTKIDTWTLLYDCGQIFKKRGHPLFCYNELICLLLSAMLRRWDFSFLISYIPLKAFFPSLLKCDMKKTRNRILVIFVMCNLIIVSIILYELSSIPK